MFIRIMSNRCLFLAVVVSCFLPGIIRNAQAVGGGNDWDVYFSQPDQDTNIGTTSTVEYIIRDKLVQGINLLQPGHTGTLATFTFSGDSSCCGFAGPIMAAISNALDRGATVRFIGDSGIDTNALWQGTSLALEAQRGVNPLILSIDDSPSGIHHNKFGLFDYGPGNRWVVSGSANFTGGAMSFQWNAAVEVRDDTLYDVYRLEAEELLAGRFHDDPAKSHAHSGSTFNIPGSWGTNSVRFSPSPSGMPLEDEMLALIGSAQDEIVFAGNVWTRTEIAMALRDAADANQGLRITGVLARDQTDPGRPSEAPYNFLTNPANYAGTNYVNFVLAHEDRGDTNSVDTAGVSDLVHSKWMVIDPTGPEPVVWHGSANWSFSALVSTSSNDENVQVIRHNGIACRFFDNFKAITARFGGRTCMASNRPPVIVSVPHQFVPLSNALSFQVVANDLIDGDTITLSISNPPPGAVFPTVTNGTSVTGNFNWASAAPAGVYTTRFVAVDNDGTQVRDVVITVAASVVARFNEVRSNNDGTDNIEFIELIALAGTDLQGISITHHNGSTAGDGELWNFNFTNSFIVPDDGITDHLGRPLGYVVLSDAGVPNMDFTLPGSLQNGDDGVILYDAFSNVIDAVAWGGPGDLDDDDPGNVTTGGLTTAGNYLHVTRSDTDDDESLQAPNSVSDDDGSGWIYVVATPGTINSGQVSGVIVIEGATPGPSNVPPVLQPIGNRSVMENAPLSFSVTATEPIDGDLITLSISNLPVGASFPTVMSNGLVSGLFSWPAAAPPGVYTMTFYAVDVDGTHAETIEISVTNVAFGGMIIISEILLDPDPVADFFGEWFEVYNTGTMGVDIDGWTIQGDQGTSHVINNGGPLIVPPLGFLVLGGSTNFASNGGTPVDYSYGLAGIVFDNGSGSLVLLDGSSSVVTRVDYDNGVTFPAVVPGASMYLLDPAFDDHVGTNWATSTTTNLWPTGTQGQFGSPGASNEMGRWGVLIIPANEPPVLAPIGNKGLFVSNALSFLVSASDPVDADVITLSASNLPPGATFATVSNAGTVSNTFNWPSAAPVGSYMVTFYAVDVDGTNSETMTINVVSNPGPAVIWFNEFHYQNATPTEDEGVEIAGLAGTVLSNFTVLAYRQDGTVYDTTPLSGVIDDEACGYGAVWFDIPGLQNGTNDGFALVRNTDSTVFQFLSYEGQLIGSAGPAAGMTSEVVTVMEDSGTPRDFSIQLTGVGADYIDFTWTGPSNQTRGFLNVPNGQFITNCTNYAPVIRPVPSQQGVVSNLLTFAVIADELLTNSADLITLSAISLPPGAVFTNAMNVGSVTGTFSWVNAGPVGVYTAIFSAVDNDGSDVVRVRIVIGQDIDVIISEIHYNPTAQPDPGGEWFELFNRSTNDLDLRGWIITDAMGIQSHIITSTNPVILPAMGFIVLGNRTMNNGGAPVNYAYGNSIDLLNEPHAIVVQDDLGFELTRVEYENGGQWPEPIGVSMFLCDPSLDENQPTNWSTSATIWPRSAGDRGSPGAANEKGCWGTAIPPQIPFIGNRSVFESNTVVFDVIANECDGDLITLTASNLPGTAVFPPQVGLGSVTGRFTWVGATPVGVYTTTFYAADVHGVATQHVEIVVRSFAQVWINEVDYDNLGTDDAEWIELVGVAGLSLDDYELLLINGNTGNEYGTSPIDLADCNFTFTDETNGFGFFTLGILNAALGTADCTPTGWNLNELQNGPQDVILLRRKSTTTDVHRIHYEGESLVGGAGTPDQVIGNSDSDADLNTLGFTTVFLTGGPGDGFDDFTWAWDLPTITSNATPGMANPGQQFGAVVSGDLDGDGCSDFAETFIFFTDLLDSNDCPKIFISQTNNNYSVLEWHSVTNLAGTLQVSTNLYTGPWTPLVTVPNAQPTASWIDTNHITSSTNRLYYRVDYPGEL